MHPVYRHLAIPEACRLDARVAKKQFLEHAAMPAADRRLFTDNVHTITWRFTLKPATLPLRAYADAEREYPEIAVVEIRLNETRHGARVAERAQRAIPYPMLLVLVHEQQCALSLAHKRFSQAQQDAVVAEDFRMTDWLDVAAPQPLETAFLASLTLAGLPQTHYYALYAAWHDCVLALACAHLSGVFCIPTAAEQRAQRREALADCHRLEHRLAELKAAIGKESQFNRQVALNTEIKQLEAQIRQAIAGL